MWQTAASWERAERDNDGIDNRAYKGHLWEKPYLMVRWEKSKIVADAVRTISNRCLLASVQLLQPDHTIHKQGSISPSHFPFSLWEGDGCKYRYCRGIKTSRWWQEDLMKSGSDMGIRVVLALILLSSWELRLQTMNAALNQPPSFLCSI